MTDCSWEHATSWTTESDIFLKSVAPLLLLHPHLIIIASWNTLLLIRIPRLILIASPVMGRRRTMSPMFRTGHGNDLLDDVYELSILEYLLDVHLGADVLLGLLVAVMVSRGGGGVASTTAAATT